MELPFSPLMSNTSKKFNYCFDRIKGQEELKKRLVQLLSREGGQSFLLTGDAGLGKHLMARTMAASLLCKERTGLSACGQCDFCRYFLAGNHPDYIELDREDKQVIRVQELRDQVINSLAQAPQLSDHKVYLINLDLINEQGQNILLKSLEEPAPYISFILLSQNTDRVLTTVLSRVVQLKLQVLTHPEMRELADDLGLDLPNFDFYFNYTRGNPGKLIRLAQDEGFPAFRQEVFAHFTKLFTGSRTDLMTELWPYFNDHKAETAEILDLWLSFLRDLSISREVGQVRLVNSDLVAELQNLAAVTANYTELSRATLLATQAIHELDRSNQVNVGFEVSICQLLLNLRKIFQEGHPID